MRYEYKYFVPNHKLEMLRKMVLPFVDLDKYAVGREHNHYTVRSIYFDSPRLECYDTKVEGLGYRKKIRLRGYDEGGDNSTVFMEIKRKFELPLKKNRAPMTFAAAKAILGKQISIEAAVQNSEKFPHAQDDARRFLYQIGYSNMRPVVLVIYEREPYLSKTDPTIRVTFDKNLRCSPYPMLDELYQEKRIRTCLHNQFIMEVKYNEYYPAWMKPIVGTLGLKWTSASKYVIAMDAQEIGYGTHKTAVISKGNMFPLPGRPGRNRDQEPGVKPAKNGQPLNPKEEKGMPPHQSTIK